MSNLRAQLIDLSGTFPAPLRENKNGILALEFVVAERKSFLSRRKLVYRCALRIKDNEKTTGFFEILKETGSGLSGGVDGMSPGLSFKKETFGLSGKEREGKIEELSVLFGKKYSYSFEYAEIRSKIGKAVEAADYSFKPCLLESSL